MTMTIRSVRTIVVLVCKKLTPLVLYRCHRSGGSMIPPGYPARALSDPYALQVDGEQAAPMRDANEPLVHPEQIIDGDVRWPFVGGRPRLAAVHTTYNRSRNRPLLLSAAATGMFDRRPFSENG